MAVEDFGGKVLGRPIEVIAIDHRNNGPDAAIKAREAYDSGADLALDMTNSAVALAVAARREGKEEARDRHRRRLVRADRRELQPLHLSLCVRHLCAGGIDRREHRRAVERQDVVRARSELRVRTADAGRFHRRDRAQGRQDAGADLYPFPATTDFSSYLLKAKNSGAQVLGLFNAGADTVNSMKQVKQFGVDKAMKVAVGLLFLSDVDALPDVFAGSRITTSWYWNEDKAARAWADKYAKRMHGLRPTDIQASDYSAATQWLNAVKAVGTTEADKVQGYLDGRQFNDFYAKGGEWRGRDHRVIHEMYVVDVLPKEQVKEPHAWFKIVQTIPPGRAFRPESASVCKKDW